MRQCHYLCDMSPEELNTLLSQVSQLFNKNYISLINEKITKDQTYFFDSPAYRIYKRGGHCKLLVSENLSEDTPKSIILEYRHKKNSYTKRFKGCDDKHSQSEISKMVGFDYDLIKVLDQTSVLNHFFISQQKPNETPDYCPHYEFVIETATTCNTRTKEILETTILSLINRTDVKYNNHISTLLNDDIEEFFRVFEKLMKSNKIKKLSSQRYCDLIETIASDQIYK